jgi:hypothetical protein
MTHNNCYAIKDLMTIGCGARALSGQRATRIAAQWPAIRISMPKWLVRISERRLGLLVRPRSGRRDQHIGESGVPQEARIIVVINHAEDS